MSQPGKFKPGQKAPASGQVEIRGPRGGGVGGPERTVTKGEPMPPTPEPGQTYVYVDLSNNGAGKRR